MSEAQSNPSGLPDYEDTASEADELELGVDVSELHGALCGFLCGGGQAGPRDWLVRLAVEPEGGAVPAPGRSLDRLYRASCEQLGDPGLGFELLLPDEESPVEGRAEALLGWCRGFLGGFGLATGKDAPLSEESREALEDLARIAGSQLSYEDEAADEDALIEVAEFVRVAAMLVYGDCNVAARGAGTLH